MEGNTPEHAKTSQSVQDYAPHSHSIVLSHRNALIFRGKFFLRILKNRIPDPSEICALEIKGEFR
jgi:hypothetical protein